MMSALALDKSPGACAALTEMCAEYRKHSPGAAAAALDC